MYNSLRLIFPVLLISSMIKSMDRPDDYKRIIPIKSISLIAFFPDTENINSASSLGFQSTNQTPFVKIRSICGRCLIGSANVLALPYTALVEVNGRTRLPNGLELTFPKETEFSILSAVDNLSIKESKKNKFQLLLPNDY